MSGATKKRSRTGAARRLDLAPAPNPELEYDVKSIPTDWVQKGSLPEITLHDVGGSTCQWCITLEEVNKTEWEFKLHILKPGVFFVLVFVLPLNHILTSSGPKINPFLFARFQFLAHIRGGQTKR